MPPPWELDWDGVEEGAIYEAACTDDEPEFEDAYDLLDDIGGVDIETALWAVGEVEAEDRIALLVEICP